MLVKTVSRVGWLTFTLTALMTGPVHAQVVDVDMFRDGSYTQTGNGNSVSLDGYFASLDINMTNSGDFVGGTVVTPVPTSKTLTLLSPTDLHLQTGLYSSLAAMSVDFPTGSYTFTGTGGNFGPKTATLTYSSDDYPTLAPYLTGTDYAGLQNVNPGAAITLHFSPYAFDSQPFAQYQFFTIYDNTTNAYVVNDSFLPISTTSVNIAANTFTAGNSYTYELDDSNRVLSTGTGAAFAPFIGYDLRTDGAFSASQNTATPEPGSLALVTGLASAFVFARRRSRG